MKLKLSNCDKTKKKSNGDKTQTLMVTKLKSQNCDKSQKLQLQKKLKKSNRDKSQARIWSCDLKANERL